MVSPHSLTRIIVLAAAVGSAPLAVTASAQDVVAREVVQPLPSPEVQRLNRALVALAKAPRERDTLIEAGQAALGVGDLEAAIGFFGRAAEVDPGHPRVAMGLGSVYLRAGRAGEALVQFERALAGGIPEQEVLGDKALTLDLVGDQPAAQAAYARLLTLDPANDEARRRLAISHAISGNRARFEEALRPLLDRRDTAAQRARAFGLAIMGDSDRATAIVEQVMPRDLATRLVPYLGYMPRLTKPQQAAAANLGIFPRAADIGRDDPRLARFAAEERADSRLAPAGPPLDARPAPPPVQAAAAAAAVPIPAPVTTVYNEPVAASMIGTVPPAASTPAAPAVVAATVAPASPTPAAATSAAVLTGSATPAANVPVPAAPAYAPASAPVPVLGVADAFADLLDTPLPDARVGGDAVDISRITVKRELPPPPPEKPKPKEPPKPVHPSRVWVQVATGKKIDALAFDWRRINREGGKTLGGLDAHTARWGQTNRLVVGPVASRDKAEAMVRELKKKGLDSFMWLSEEGEAVQPLK